MDKQKIEEDQKKIITPDKQQIIDLEKELGPLEWNVSMPKVEDASKVPSNMIKTGTNRWITMVKENWFVPVGMLLTVGAFTRGLRHYYNQEHMRQNYMMRARVSAQFFTLFAIVAGVTYKGYKNQKAIDPDKL